MNDKNTNREREEVLPKSEIEEYLKENFSKEQVYTIALFDILGFSNFVKENKTQLVLDLYQKTVDLIEKQKSGINENGNGGYFIPVPLSNKWDTHGLTCGTCGWVNVSYFSDTFIIYMNYDLRTLGFWLRDEIKEPYPLLIGEIGTEYYPVIYSEKHSIYISFLHTCMDFFCRAIIAGIPLRGCISTGLATMNPYKSIFLGKPLVEAARGESAQNSIGIAFGKSFNHSHPVYNNYFIPYLAHIKEKTLEEKNWSLKDGKFPFSPMLLDWARYWRKYFKDIDFRECINRMNTNPNFSAYYDNAVKFFDFSAKHENWFNEINREGIKDILDYYKKTEEWYNSVSN